MNMKQFQYALVLSHEKSFSRAAEALSISQPSLSQYIKKIEEDTGSKLFMRNGNCISLTEAGEIYIEAGRKILDLENQMFNSLNDLEKNLIGKLTIGVSPYRSVYLMPKLIAEFKSIYPGVNVVLDERVSADLKEGAEFGEFDLCISTLPIDESKFNYERIMSDETILAVPKSFEINEILKEKAIKDDNRVFPVVNIKLMKNTPFVMLGKEQSFQKILYDICAKEDITLQRVAECKTMITLNAMINEGLGAGIVPYSLIKYNKEAQASACYYSIMQFEEKREMIVFYRKNQYLSQPAKDMINIFKNI